MNNIAVNLERICGQIHAAEQKYRRLPGSVRLVAVSKTRSADEIRQLIACGQRDFGENYLQEANTKIAELRAEKLIWHFIGPIQSNKTRLIAAEFDWVHSVDRLKIARRLHDIRPAALPPLNICIQINISAESSKSGIPVNELIGLATEVALLDRLRLRGLMAMPAPVSDPAQQRESFRLVHQCLETLRTAGHELDTLSMGTSNDLDAAIAEGATMVRIGSAIFGPRYYPED